MATLLKKVHNEIVRNYSEDEIYTVSTSCKKSYLNLVGRDLTIDTIKPIEYMDDRALVTFRDHESHELYPPVEVRIGNNGNFVHKEKTGKAQTHKMTYWKEQITMLAFKHGLGTSGGYGKLIEYVKSSNIEDKELITSKFLEIFVSSSLRQYDAFMKQFGGVFKNASGYTIEHKDSSKRGSSRCKYFYDIARREGFANDIWNPADIWIIKNSAWDGEPDENYERGYKKILSKSSTTLTEVNLMIAKGIELGNIFPISLKQIESNRHGKCKLISDKDVELAKKISDESHELKCIYLSKQFKNVQIICEDGFTLRCGNKAGGSNVYPNFEGHRAKSHHQIGAVSPRIIDAKFPNIVERSKNKILTESQFKTIINKIYSFSSNAVMCDNRRLPKDEAIELYAKMIAKKDSDSDVNNTLQFVYNLMTTLENFIDKHWKDDFAGCMTKIHMIAMRLGIGASEYILIE